MKLLSIGGILFLIIVTISYLVYLSPKTQPPEKKFIGELIQSNVTLYDVLLSEPLVTGDETLIILKGEFSDSCTQLAPVEVVQDEGSLTFYARGEKPQDALCASVITPFEVEYLLETVNFKPGEYRLFAGTSSATLTIAPKAL